MIDLLLKILSIIVPSAMAFAITFSSCREIGRLRKVQLMKRWEVGFFSGWLIGGTIFYFALSILCLLYPHAPFEVWRTLMFSFSAALFITGPAGIAAVYVPWRLFARKRKPKILGCGLHGSVRSRLVILPGTISNNKEFVAIRCKTVLSVSREKFKEKLCVPRKIAPPPLTETEWKVINYRVNA